MEQVRIRRAELTNVFLWLFLNAMDYCVTMAVMGKGSGYEGNPIIAQLNPDMFLIYKLLIPVVVLFGLYKWNRLRLLKPLNIIMGIVVLWGTVWLII